jgi:hypothetical protein
MEFALNPGNGGVENGPATNFFSTQDAIVSVTFAPNRNAFFEFFTVRLSELIEENKHLLLKSELARAKKCVDFLTTGAPAFQLRPLPGCCVKNSKNAFLFGANVTDTIASWVEKKFVAGPFSTSPLPGFRANSILAVPQPSKTRICIKVSLPNGKSFNDNINKNDLERVKMSSARNFGYSITEASQTAQLQNTTSSTHTKMFPRKRQNSVTRDSHGWVNISSNLGKCSVRQAQCKILTSWLTR